MCGPTDDTQAEILKGNRGIHPLPVSDADPTVCPIRGSLGFDARLQAGFTAESVAAGKAYRCLARALRPSGRWAEVYWVLEQELACTV